MFPLQLSGVRPAWARTNRPRKSLRPEELRPFAPGPHDVDPGIPTTSRLEPWMRENIGRKDGALTNDGDSVVSPDGNSYTLYG